LGSRKPRPEESDVEQAGEAGRTAAAEQNSVAGDRQPADLAAVDCSALSVAELKDLIAASGLTTQGCLEKPELVARAEEAKARLQAGSGGGGSPS